MMFILCSLESACSRLPINVNWTFFARCYDWAAKRDRKSAISIQRDHFDAKFQV